MDDIVYTPIHTSISKFTCIKIIILKGYNKAQIIRKLRHVSALQ